MATDYEIDISLSQTTLNDLKNGGFSLYAFKAVQATVNGGAPLVWFKTDSFLTTTQVKWQEQYQAYISTSEIIANGEIDASNSINMNLGQTADVSENGLLTSAQGGTSGAVSILNQGSAEWTAGISQMTNGVANPMVAIPLYGNMMDVVAPIEKVLVMFATESVNTGVVIYQSYSQGLMIDLTADNTRAVNFDINTGWDADGGTWATKIEANADLVPLLITTDSQQSFVQHSAVRGPAQRRIKQDA